MKIIIISPYPLNHSGGVETFVKQLKKGLEKEKIEVEVVTLSKNQLKFIPKQFKLLTSLFLVRNLKKKNLNGSILHFNAWTSYLAKFFNNPSIATSHGTIVNMVNSSPQGFSFLRRGYLTKVTGFLERRGFNYCDKVVAVSEQVKKELIKDYSINEKKIKVINIGIDTAKASGDLREQLGYSKKDVVLLTSGRGDYNKGMDLMLSIAEKMNSRHDSKFLAAGSSFIKKDVDWFKVKSFPKSKMPLVYSSADIYLHASRYESYGLSLLEAMAQGLPVVSFDVGIASEAVKDGYNGFLIPKGDFNLFEKKVEELITNKFLRKKLGKKARETIEKKFSIAKMVNEYISVYNSFLK